MPTYKITQDRWCDLCSQPAALVVERRTRPPRTAAHACSQKHAETIVRLLEAGTITDHSKEKK